MDKKQYEVLKTFDDKNTKRRHKKGTKYKTDAERAKLLKSRGFLADIKKADKDESRKTKA